MKKIIYITLFIALAASVVFVGRELSQRVPRADVRPDLAYRQLASLFNNHDYLSGW